MLLTLVAAGGAAIGDACPASIPAAQCLSTVDGSDKRLLICCARQHMVDVDVVRHAVLQLHRSYEALTYEDIYLATDAPVLVDVGKVCLEAMQSHPDDNVLRHDGTSLLSKVGLSSLLPPASGAPHETKPDEPARSGEYDSALWSGAAATMLGIAFALASQRRLMGLIGRHDAAMMEPTWSPAMDEDDNSPAGFRRRRRRHRTKAAASADACATSSQIAGRDAPPAPADEPAVPFTPSTASLSTSTGPPLEGALEETLPPAGSAEAVAPAPAADAPGPPPHDPDREPPQTPPLLTPDSDASDCSATVTSAPSEVHDRGPDKGHAVGGADDGDDCDESRVCVICWERPRTHACVPCGHRCLCSAEACTTNHAACPLCRTPVTGVMRVWE